MLSARMIQLTTSRLSLAAPLAIMIVSAATLAVALAAEYVGDIPPCILCEYQRVPFMAALALGLIGAAFRGVRPIPALSVGGGALAFLTGAGFAAYHSGVERHWWASIFAACGTNAKAETLEELTAQILATPVVRCDEIPWKLLGLSITNYNLIWSTALFLIACVALKRILKEA
jgi:disulfide bond formation protein DsbB